jgi:glutamyl/glutaminyl-tRNA synthetase
MLENVVTRFAPSPTGYLHVGGARTAIFNWLYARRTGGKFLLRIEDTDFKRNTVAAMQQVIADLRWLGIDWDEGPEVSGPHGPYLQSQRRDIYEKFVKKLLAENTAYYCFDTPEELEAMRKKAAAQKSSLIYRRPEVFPTEEEAAAARRDGKLVTVRFAMPSEQTIVVNDVVRGEVSFEARELSDFIIQKSDGFPTYNFACVIDDELMEVTHVCRGQEHLMNTPCQQVLQDALGFRRPVYVHMSVTVSEGGGKLSKRERPEALRQIIRADKNIDLEKLAGAGGISVEEVKKFIDGNAMPDMPSVDAMAKYLGVELPEINVVDFFRSGYLPETMVNFLALLGWNPGGKREIMGVDELVGSFDLSRLTKSNSLFDRKKLIAFNTEHIKMTPPDKLLRHFKAYLKEVESPVQSADDETLLRLLKINEGAQTLAMVEHKSRFLFVGDNEIRYDEKAVQKVLKAPNFMLGVTYNGLSMLKIVREKLVAMSEFTEQGIENMLRSLAEEKGVGLGKVAQPLRVAICGTTISPPIFDSVQLLSKERTLARIDNTLSKFGNAK